MRTVFTLKVVLLAAMLLLSSGKALGLGGEPGEEERPQLIQKVRPVVPEAPERHVAEAPPPPAPPAPTYAPPAEPSAKPCTVTCYRPVWRTRDINCKRQVCRHRDEVRTCKVPVYSTEKRTRKVTCWKIDYETVTRQVTTCVNTIDERGCCVPSIAVCEVPCKVARQVPYEVEQEYTVCVTNWETKEYTVKVPYLEWEEFTCKQPYCEWEPYEVALTCCRVCCQSPCCCGRI